MSDQEETRPETPKFDFSAFPPDTLFYDRRTGFERRDKPATAPKAIATPPPPPVIPLEPKRPPERRARKERRRRVDPTTFEKQYTEDEIEFMNAIQNFKTQTGKLFPTYGDVLRIAARLGYRKGYPIDDDYDEQDTEPCEIEPALPR